MLKKVLFFVIPILCAVSLVVPNRISKYSESTFGIHRSIIFDEEQFNRGVFEVKAQSIVYQDLNIFGGVVPHHLLASFIIADFFKRLSMQSPETVIIVGPDHFQKGSSKIISGYEDWDTPFGKVETNKIIVDRLRDNGALKIDENTIDKEHSVAGLVPFIKYFLPQTKVVTIVISPYVNKNDIERLSSDLKDLVSSNTTLIASVDFSHYLTGKEAEKNDEDTLKIISDFNYDKLFTLNSDNLDSPGSMATVMMTMEKLNRKNIQVIHHTNSGVIYNAQTTPVTSYYSIYY